MMCRVTGSFWMLMHGFQYTEELGQVELENTREFAKEYTSNLVLLKNEDYLFRIYNEDGEEIEEYWSSDLLAEEGGDDE